METKAAVAVTAVLAVGRQKRWRSWRGCRVSCRSVSRAPSNAARAERDGLQASLVRRGLLSASVTTLSLAYQACSSTPSGAEEVQPIKIKAASAYADDWILNTWRDAGTTSTMRLSMHLCKNSGHADQRMVFTDIQATLTYPSVSVPGQRFPLVIFTPGFASDAAQYKGFAEAVARGGGAVLLYDVPSGDLLNDDALITLLNGVIDYAASSTELQQLVSVERVLLAGHSRGAKISSLTAVANERVTGLCLLDPIDNTVFAPLSPGFPSAVAALRDFAATQARPLPVAIIGAGFGSDCAPADSNYLKYYDAVDRLGWLLLLPSAGHSQFLDRRTAVAQRAVCGTGTALDADVHASAVAVCLSWISVTCGPFFPCTDFELPESIDERREIAAQIKGLSQNRAKPLIFEDRTPVTCSRIPKLCTRGTPLQWDVSTSVGFAATVTAQRLRSHGVAVENAFKL